MRSDEPPIRVGIIAPMLSVRLGLAAMLADAAGIEVTASAATLDELDAAKPAADVLVLAGRAINPLDMQEFLTRAAPGDEAPVLLLFDEPPDRSSLPSDFPVWGMLAMDTSAERLAQAIHTLHTGLFVSEPGWAPRLASAAADLGADLDGRMQALSPREREVLELLALGLANKQISARLGLSENTVKYHISSIYSKLGAGNRAEAVRLGARLGYISV